MKRYKAASSNIAQQRGCIAFCSFSGTCRAQWKREDGFSHVFDTLKAICCAYPNFWELTEPYEMETGSSLFENVDLVLTDHFYNVWSKTSKNLRAWTTHQGVYQGFLQTLLGFYGYAGPWTHIVLSATVYWMVSDAPGSSEKVPGNELERVERVLFRDPCPR